jgi:uncharacterized paraquat-inducible protein A
MPVDFSEMIDVMENHQKSCGILEFTNKHMKEIRCDKCGMRLYKSEQNMIIETEDAIIEFL